MQSSTRGALFICKNVMLTDLCHDNCIKLLSHKASLQAEVAVSRVKQHDMAH